MEDWGLPDTPDTNHPSSTSEHTKTWDDDFEVETRNRHATSWTATPILGADEEGRTVTARLRCAASAPSRDLRLPIPSPPPPTPFFPSNQHPSPEPLPWPVYSLFRTLSAPIHLQHPLFTTPFYVRLCLITPFVSNTHNERGGSCGRTVVRVQREGSSWSTWPGDICSRTGTVKRWKIGDAYIRCVFCGCATPPPYTRADTAVTHSTLSAFCTHDNMFGFDDNPTGCIHGRRRDAYESYW